MDLLLLCSLFPLIALFIRVLKWRIRIARVRRTTRVVPVLLPSWSILRAIWPRKYQTYHNDWQFQLRKHYGSDGRNILALISLFGDDAFFVANADAIVEISSNPSRFPKDAKLYGNPIYFIFFDAVEPLEVYGRNVLTTEGSRWRHHRKIISKSFTEKNYELVFEESVRQVKGIMEMWESESETGSILVARHYLL